MIFLNPYFLFGLFALAIPIVVHLFNFRRYKIFYFSNTRFLQTLQEQTKRKSQLKKLIILILRLFAISSIVFSFARPYIPLEDQNVNLKGYHYVVLYIDNSFSMDGITSHGTLLYEAKDKAKSIIDAYAEDDKFMLVTNDLEAKHQHFFSKEEIKNEIDAVKISSNTRQLDRMMQYAQNQLDRQLTENKKIYLISDFQRTTTLLENIEVEKDVFTYLIPLKANKINNVYIDTAWFDTPVFHIGKPIALHVILKNISEEAVEKLPVKLFINGNQKALASADIAAGGLNEVQLNFTLFEAGIQQAYIEIPDYPVTFDDKLYLSFLLRKHNAVLNVYGEKESPYLYALFALDSGVLYQAVNDRNIDYSQLKNQDLIILDQVKEQSSGFMKAMEEYVCEGGNLLFIPSIDKETTLSNTFNNTLQLNTYLQLDTQKTRVASLHIEHPLFANIFERYDETMNFPEVFRYYIFRKGIYACKENLMLLENKHEFLIRQQLDKGNVYLLAAPLDDAFSTFQKHALFVPTLYNMAILQAKQDEAYHTIGNNNRISLPKIEIQGDNVLEIKHDKTGFSFIPEIRQQLSGQSLFVHDQIKDAGNYFLMNKEEILSGLSFNYNRKESDMQCFDRSELEEQIKINRLKQFTVLNLQNKSTNAIVREIQAVGLHLWQYFILLALLCLLAEVILLRIWK